MIGPILPSDPSCCFHCTHFFLVATVQAGKKLHGFQFLNSFSDQHLVSPFGCPKAAASFPIRPTPLVSLLPPHAPCQSSGAPDNRTETRRRPSNRTSYPAREI